VHFQSTLVMDESYLAEAIHKEAYPRMRGTHHLCQHFMAHLKVLLVQPRRPARIGASCKSTRARRFSPELKSVREELPDRRRCVKKEKPQTFQKTCAASFSREHGALLNADHRAICDSCGVAVVTRSVCDEGDAFIANKVFGSH
jgi:hypothetical protein